jgi:predicted negative regulator of RcsB-dependent stress response
MASLDLQEQEQLEALKAWWKDNGSFVLGTLLVVVVAMGGWRGWQYYQNKQSTEAATLYAEFTRQLQSNDAKRVNDAAAAVMEKYSGTAYASRAALMAAQVNEYGKDIARAKTQLQWAIEHAGEATLKDVARLRLAAILLDEQAYDDAMKLLNAAHPDSFNGLYADLKGDVLSAQGKTDEARTAYKLAYEKTDAKSMYRTLTPTTTDARGGAK